MVKCYFRLEVLASELLGRLGRDELHRRALHRLGDRLRIAEVVLLSLYFAGMSRASCPSFRSLRMG